jgi:peptide/nickel transport system substrate-binding protein
LGLPEASLNPIGYGPYQIEQWDHGRQLILNQNPEYRPNQAGQIGFERIVFRFIGNEADSALDQLATGECDVLDERLLPLASFDQIESSVAQSGAVLQASPGSIVERLEFGLRPSVGSEYLRLLEDKEMRTALASCIDRVELADNLFEGSTDVPASFLPTGHYLYSPGQDPISYDPETAQSLLDDLGWLLAEDGSGIRVALGVDGLANATTLSFTLLTLPNDLASQVGQAIQADLAECGVDITLETMPADELFLPWPDGPIFGRDFQMALWAWPTFNSPACEMFAGWELPSAENPLGINASGYQSAAYDRACGTVLLSPSDTAEYDEAIAQVQQEFTADVPALPLYVRPRLLAYADWICGPEPAASPATLFWNLEEWAPCP